MGAAPKVSHEEVPLDDLFLKVFSEVVDTAIKTTADAVEEILNASKVFLGDAVENAIRDFHLLYSESAQSQSEDINQEVDDLFDAIQNEIAAGNDANDVASGVVENEAKKKARLSLAAVQKRLETLIQFDSKARERLIPVLMSMQFEDEIRQVLKNLIQVWTLAIDGTTRSVNLEELKQSLAQLSCTTIEKELLYRLVLKTEPPAQIIDADSEHQQFIKGLL